MKIPKLSDSILLGSTLLTWCGGEVLRHDGRGCAIGMGLVANGIDYSAYSRVFGSDCEQHHRMWPWLIERRQNLLSAPCGCSPQEMYSPPDSYEVVITHIFDEHVMCAKDWTLEKLVDYVRSVEPAEAPRCAEPAAPCTDAVSLGVK